jgi:hypothetical protein
MAKEQAVGWELVVFREFASFKGPRKALGVCIEDFHRDKREAFDLKAPFYMQSANKLLDANGIDVAIKRLTSDIADGNSKLDFALVGIQKGGVYLADRLGQ